MTLTIWSTNFLKKDNNDNIDDFDQQENDLETTEYEFEDEYDTDEAIWDLSLNGYARGGFSARSGIQSRYVNGQNTLVV